MKIGYQGTKYCYSYQAIKRTINLEKEMIGFETFEEVFINLDNDNIDFAMIPIENSTGGTIFINYDLFYQYKIKILAEVQVKINHCLYGLPYSQSSDIETVMSHPQALSQCKKNCQRYNFKQIESWDTVGSINQMIKLNKLNNGCIAPPKMEKYYSIKLLKHNFSDQKDNITRFYFITKNKLVRFDKSPFKFSLSVILLHSIGSLTDYLQYFKQKNINLTKIESRPIEICSNEETFKYMFYLEGTKKDIDMEAINELLTDTNVTLYGIFPEYNCFDIPSVEKNLNVGIIGFGRFGQFMGKEMVNYKWNVFATSRKDYTDIATQNKIIFVNFESFLKIPLDVVIISVSILSLENVINKIPVEYWNNKLVVDVLSVKSYPKQILQHLNSDILYTHPLFGPDSCNESWTNKKMVYWYDKVTDNNRLLLYLDFWKEKGCILINMRPEEHDIISANSQFLAHLVGRMVNLLNPIENIIDTDGYKSLLQIKDHSINDSWELFEGLAKYNSSSKKTINKLKLSLTRIENKLYPKLSRESATGKKFNQIRQLIKEGKYIINCSIGIPSWTPPAKYMTNLNSSYSTNYGEENLRLQLISYYNDNNIKLSNILITPGAKPSLHLILQLLTESGSKWLIPIPYWVSYPDLVEVSNGIPIFLNSSIDNNWTPNINEIDKYFQQDDVNGIIISYPNNPTGLFYNNTFIEKLIQLACNYGKYIISDEVYMNLSSKYTLYTSNNNIISVNSFSKGYGMPGWRIGWIIANKKTINLLAKLQSTIYTCASLPGQQIGLRLLQDNWRPDLSILRDYKFKLTDLFINNDWSLINNTNISMYLFPYHKTINIGQFTRKLLENGLAVMEGEPFGVKQCIRLTLLNDKAKMETVYQIIKNCI